MVVTVAATNMLTIPPRVSETNTAAAPTTMTTASSLTTVASEERTYSSTSEGVARRRGNASYTRTSSRARAAPIERFMNWPKWLWLMNVPERAWSYAGTIQ